MVENKICRGTGKAIGYGCGKKVPVALYGKPNRVYGLGKSCKCYPTWLTTTVEGSKVLEKAKLSGKKKVEKQIKAKSREEKSLSLNWKKLLQTDINKIVRAIDNGLTCLARGYRGQMHAGHVYARGGNQYIKYNLHNIHRQSAQSNHHQNDDGLLREGVVKEYGQDYMDFISELRRTPEIKYTNKEYRILTNKARVILKELKKVDKIYSKSERIELRNRINLELGIYDAEFCEFEQ